MFCGPLGAPNHTGGRSGGVEASMREVAFMGRTELTVDLAARLCNLEKKKNTISILYNMCDRQPRYG